jgi:hypothetical protein
MLDNNNKFLIRARILYTKDNSLAFLNISVSDFLEQRSSEAQKNQEIDLVDFLFDSNSKELRAP